MAQDQTDHSDDSPSDVRNKLEVRVRKIAHASGPEVMREALDEIIAIASALRDRLDAETP